ncbi:MAG: hypothetical protein QM704_07355 [Anaeromyxobacteraceae bacterium]
MPLAASLRAAVHALTAAALLAAGPALAQGEEAEEVAGDEIVAEALFLADTLPPGSRDFNLQLSVARDEAHRLTTSPTLQFAAPLGERLGFTVDVGIPRDSGALENPAASLKLVLREAAADATGLSACADVYGSTHRAADTEVALGLGALRAAGPLALRASALVATGAGAWAPHLHAGASAALALSPRWRALAEVVAEVSRGGTVFSAGPTFKVALTDTFAVMGGALFELGKSALPVFTLQLSSTM